MHIYPFAIVSLVLMVAGFTVNRWLNAFKFIQKIKKAAEAIDKEDIKLPAVQAGTNITVELFRNFQKNGSKIVVAHFMNDVRRELQAKIRNGIFAGAVVPLFAIVFLASYEANDLQNGMASSTGSGISQTSGGNTNQTSGGNTNQATAANVAPPAPAGSIIHLFGVVANRTLILFGTSIGIFVFALYSFWGFTQLYDWVEKYESVLV